MEITRVYWLHTISPTHVGTGQGAGYIDLPIHRDKFTGWPLIPASTLKGVWARHYSATEDKRRTDPKLRLAAFERASDAEVKASNAGSLVPTDARLVCLPMRSFQGTFAWCTSPLALQMLRRDLNLGGIADLPPEPLPAEEEIRVTSKTRLEQNGRVFLEDLDFGGKQCAAATAWAERLAAWVFPDEQNKAWRDLFVERFAVVSNSVFDFFTQTGTEGSTRVRIDDDLKTVALGQLWNEEALPAETILAGLITCDRVYTSESQGITAVDLIHEYATESLILQMGGKATVGRGRVRCVFTP